MTKSRTVLIVGGGIAGLTAGHALGREGHAVKLVERNPEWRTEGGGILVHANGMRVLRAFRLGAAVERAGARVTRWQFCDQAGETLSQSNLVMLWGDVGNCIGIERSQLQRILVDSIGDVECRLELSIQSLSQNDECVSVVLSDGSRGTYDLLVGADGISSTVRRLMLNPSAPTYTGAMAWRSVAPIRPRGLTSLQFHLGENCFFGLCPVGQERTYGFGNITGPRAHEPVLGRLGRLCRQFAGFSETVQDYLAALACDEAIHCAPVDWLANELWHRGRVVLIGDAAHASSPMMVQGGCMAMEDAYVLANTLGQAPTVAEALDRYVERRRSRVHWVQQQSEAAAQSFRLSPSERNLALRQYGDEIFMRRFSPLVAAP